jgi:hypothetical protein
VQQCVQVVCEGASAGKDVQPQLLHLFGDVHAMLTSPDKLRRFRQLPFEAVKAWADSGDLIVDSEDSVAVALGGGRQALPSASISWRSCLACCVSDT